MKSKQQKRRNSGFTLIEIMVVVLIVGLLIGTVGPNIWNALFSSQAKVAGNQIRLFHSTLDQYKLEVYRFPDSLDDLTEPNPTTGQPFSKVIPLDPWNNEYDYERKTCIHTELLNEGTTYIQKLRVKQHKTNT